MAISVQNHRTKWRYVAPKISPNESLSNSSIRNNKPIKFSPPKSDDLEHDALLPKRDESDQESLVKRFSSNFNNSNEPRQQLTLLNQASPFAQALTFIMKKGHIERKGSLDEQNLSSRENNHELCSCIQIKETYNLVKEIQYDFLQFQKKILNHLKNYQAMIRQEIENIYKFIRIFSQQQETKFERHKTEIVQKDKIRVGFESISQKEEDLKTSKSDRIKMQQNFHQFLPNRLHFQTQFHQLDAISSTSIANFDKFFQIMMKMRKTLDVGQLKNQQQKQLKQSIIR